MIVACLLCPKVKILHLLFPPFMAGARTIAAVKYTDMDAEMHEMLMRLCNGQDAVLTMLRSIQVEVEANAKAARKGAVDEADLAAPSALGGRSKRDKAVPLAAQARKPIPKKPKESGYNLIQIGIFLMMLYSWLGK